MLKMILVDDYKYDLIYASKIIDWEKSGIRLVGMAESGIHALDLIKEHNPDLVITDIQMPEMDGFALARIIKENYPSVKTLIMSCHCDFVYAKEALKLNIMAYITKPLLQEDVQNTVQAVVESIEKENKNRAELQQMHNLLKEALSSYKKQLLYSILSGNCNDEAIGSKLKNWDLDLSTAAYQMIAIEFNRSFAKQCRFSITEMTEIIERGFVQANPASGITDLIAIPVNPSAISLLAVYSSESQAPADVSSTLRDLLLQQASVDQQHYTLKESRLFDRLGDAYLHYCTLSNGAAGDYAGDREAAESIEQQYRQPRENEIKGAITELIQIGTQQEIESFLLNNLGPESESNSGLYSKTRALIMVVTLELCVHELGNNLDLLLGSKESYWITINRLENYRDVYAWVLSVFLKVKSWVNEKNIDENELRAGKIKEYINTYYMRDITVKTIASQLYLSPNYVNSLFKQCTGLSIPEYLVSVRIERAKEMICNPKVKLSSVVSSVGYNHIPHFNKIFKQKVGLTLGEYRDKISKSWHYQ